MTPIDFVLGKDTTTGQVVTIPQVERLRGTYIIGRAGSGKTHLMETWIASDIQAGHGVCVIDPHGDMIQNTLARIPSNRVSDVVLLDPLDPDYAFGLNMFETDPGNTEAVTLAVSYVLEMFAKLFTHSGDFLQEAPNMARTLRNAAYVLIDNYSRFGLTLAEVPLLIDSPAVRKQLLANVSSSHALARRFWEEYDSLTKPTDRFALTGSTVSRIEPFLQNEYIKHVVGQSKSTINFRRLMDESRIILVPLPRQHQHITSLLGSLIISQIIQAAFSRATQSEAQRKPFFLYIDELGLFSSPAFADLIGTLFAESRKFKLGFIGAHQWRQQLDADTRAATLNAGSLVVFGISGEDGEELAKEYSVQPAQSSDKGILSADIIPRLLLSGHPNRNVVEFIQKYLRPLAEARGEQVENMSIGRGVSVPIKPVLRVQSSKLPKPFLYQYDQNEVKRGLIKLNDWLYNALRNTEVFPLVDAEMIEMLRLLAPALCWPTYFALKYQTPTQMLRDAARRVTERENERKRDCWEPQKRCKGEDEAKRLLDKEEAYTKRLRDAEGDFMVAGLQYILSKLREQKKYYPHGAPVERHGFCYDGEMKETEGHQESIIELTGHVYTREAYAHDTFLLSLRTLLTALRETPLLADGRVYGVPPVGQRQFADMEKEVAKQLAHPSQPYTARVKLGVKECTLQALPLAPSSSTGTALRERILWRCYSLGLLKKRKEIDDEIVSRQERLTRFERLWPDGGEPHGPAPHPLLPMLTPPVVPGVPNEHVAFPATKLPNKAREAVPPVPMVANINGYGHHPAHVPPQQRVANINGYGYTQHPRTQPVRTSRLKQTPPAQPQKKSRQDDDEE